MSNSKKLLKEIKKSSRTWVKTTKDLSLIIIVSVAVVNHMITNDVMIALFTGVSTWVVIVMLVHLVKGFAEHLLEVGK
ncbi:hypothetical protein LCGC14_2270780 [marine sediment metagenome]|uniref:Uncharacterized protein n=1 Tax=marine sediment metagenome TaxID=412755 RepID=A0A0F9FS57_9ZZZZ